MRAWLQRYLSIDDLWSVLGYLLLISVAAVVNPEADWQVVSVGVAGLLAIFWAASRDVRARNAEKVPNARVIFWTFIAAVSAVIASR